MSLTKFFIILKPSLSVITKELQDKFASIQYCGCAIYQILSTGHSNCQFINLLQLNTIKAIQHKRFICEVLSWIVCVQHLQVTWGPLVASIYSSDASFLLRTPSKGVAMTKVYSHSYSDTHALHTPDLAIFPDFFLSCICLSYFPI